MLAAKITSIRFTNFKSLRNYTVSLQDTNILVGPNNAGKSTILRPLRILEAALRRARSKNPERVHLPSGTLGFGHRIALAQLSVSLENVATDYNSEDSHIAFRLSNRNVLILFLPNDGGCTLCWENEGTAITSVGRFNTAFPIAVQVVPVLGPLEHKESYVTEGTVKDALSTHRASRHFRNYWHYFPDGWELFADMIEATWPGMKMEKPKVDVLNKQLTMFVLEDRVPREMYWSGFGFQIWCQLLTHISRSANTTLLAIDEPEIYLHPDVQRQLLAILRGLDADVVLATHSVEIISEADPGELLLVQKGRLSAQRLRDVEGMQVALNSIGSAHNVALAHLARTKKSLFVEGFDDYRTLRRFAKILGYTELATGSEITAFESGGFSSWDRVKSFAWGVKKTIDANMKIFTVYDRDYFCDEHLTEITDELQKELTGAAILERKEMENYLLNVDALERALTKQLEQKSKRLGESTVQTKTIHQYLSEITESERLDCQSKYVGKKLDYHRSKGSGKDLSTLSKQAMQDFEAKWSNMPQRLAIAPGKAVIRALRDAVQQDLGVNLTDFQIIDEYKPQEIPGELLTLIKQLDAFRQTASKS